MPVASLVSVTLTYVAKPSRHRYAQKAARDVMLPSLIFKLARLRWSATASKRPPMSITIKNVLSSKTGQA